MIPTGPPVPREIVAIRALPGLGDGLCLVPALQSLRAGAPSARITVVGHPNGRWMIGRYRELIDDWIDLPHWPSIIECRGTAEETAALLRSVRDRRRFDLAVQLHGSGGPINWLGVALRARRVAVHTTPDRLGPWAVSRRWPDRGHEADRLADLVVAAGFPRGNRALRFPLTMHDHREAVAVIPPAPDGFVVVHPGASRPDRRWAIDGFASVASSAAACGRQVVVTAGPGERALAERLVDACALATVVSGTTIGGLAALLARADAVVVNDTGVAHVSVAVGTPTVVVGTTSDLDRWGPRDRVRHRVVQTVGDTGDVSRVIAAMREVLLRSAAGSPVSS